MKSIVNVTGGNDVPVSLDHAAERRGYLCLAYAKGSPRPSKSYACLRMLDHPARVAPTWEDEHDAFLFVS